MSKKRQWWQDQDDPSLDDDVEVVEQDDDGDWIDNFRFGDYRADKGLSSADAIWKRYGYTGTFSDPSYSRLAKGLGLDYATSKKIEAAQRLVQGFVDTFALDNPLTARFSDADVAARGDDGAKDVIVSHRPLLDRTLAEHDAHSIMTAQAANAAARARFGGVESRVRSEEVRAATAGTPEARIAEDLATILDGHRIDTAFRRDYPGYEDVYAPAQAYIARGLLKGRETFDLEDFAGASIANAALNFDQWTDWTGRETEHEWWKGWADHYAHGSVDQFVDGVLEGIAHIHEELPPKPDQPKSGDEPGNPSGEKGDEGGQGGKQDGDDEGKQEGKQDGDQPDDDEGEDKPESGGENPDDGEQKTDGQGQGDGSDEGGQTEVQPKSIDLPTQLGKGVSLTGMANGQSKDISESDAERLAEAASALVIGRDAKEVGEVYWSAASFVREAGHYMERIKVQPESAANGYVRRAFTRSRTAHFATERGHKNGRIDNRSLPRIASDDYRLFSKRTAPSETRYRVWLLVDNSGSMGGKPVIEAVNLAASVALAVRHVPNVALDVWAWTSSLRISGSSFSAVRVYANGDPITKIGDTGVLSQGGTPDNAVLSWAAREIVKQCRPDEVPVIIMASDGSGGLASEAYCRDPDVTKGWAPDQVARYREQAGPDRVALARKAGIKVLSVAIGDLNVKSQDLIYGKGNHLPWQGSIKAMAKPLGDLLARVASNRVK